MAGYIFAIGNSDPLSIISECANIGVYSTYINSLSPNPFEGTMTDYISMRPGDNVYFFCKRKFYGIGELINVGSDCKYCNYPNSSILHDYSYDDVKDQLLVDFGENSHKNRWICTFKGSPYFFKKGIDMDEVLKYKPDTFKMIRAFWKVSFIKINEEENNSLKEIFLLRHQREIEFQSDVFPESNACHDHIKTHILNDYLISTRSMLQSVSNGSLLKHEMALEAGVVYDLCHDRIDILDHWDYVSHQVVASPFKPIDYMDKIDVFATRYLPNTKIPCKYLVCELKKDTTGYETIDQILKYVDWVCKEYAFDDYDAINACIIAAGFDESIYDHYQTVVQRFYTLGSHPATNKKWNALKLIKYSVEDGELDYTDETP